MPKGKTIASLGELGTIAQLTHDLPKQSRDLLCGIGDDAAVLKGRSQPWLVTTDLLQEGIHFDSRYLRWEDIGYKSLQVNLSDIAAMGGAPLFYWLTLCLPSRFSLSALQGLRRGLKRASQGAGITCAGGDMNHASHGVTISITLLGRSQSVIAYRHGAKAGDDLYVTGRLGEAALGWALLQSGKGKERAAQSFCRRLARPQARLEAGQKLTDAGLVHAMIDLSDGLAKDLPQLLEKSRKGATIDLTTLQPRPRFLQFCRELKTDPWDFILGGGDDYELLFAAPSQKKEVFASWSRTLGLPITKVGKIVSRRQLVYRDAAGRPVKVRSQGYGHF